MREEKENQKWVGKEAKL